MSTLELRPATLAPFRTMPLLTTRGSMSIARALVEGAPELLPEYVDASRVRLISAIKAAEQAMTERRKTIDDPQLERSFDLLVDHVWSGLRTGLGFWRIYAHAGVELFDPSERAELELDAKRELARQAESIESHLFGEGLAFLRMSYPEQAEHMAERLRFIESEGLGAVFVELVGAHPVALVRVCQRRYEAMVHDRHLRKSGVRVDLRRVRDQVRAAAEDYANLLLSTLHGADEARRQEVFAALEPMRAPRATLVRAAADDEELAAELGEVSEDEGLEELAAEPDTDQAKAV